MTRTMKNTLRCVLVLFIISAVSVALLAIANKFLKVTPKLDAKTAALINQIAPTGLSNEESLSKKKIRMIDIGSAGYQITDLAAFNKDFGGQGAEVRALYASVDVNGKTTFVVESQGIGYVDAIVMLIAYDAENKISGITVKSQQESYWDRIPDEEALFKSFIGKSGAIVVSDIAAATGATIKGTLGGMAKAVSIGNEFIVHLGGEAPIPPFLVVDPDLKTKLQRVSGAVEFMQYTTVGADKTKVSAVYKGTDAAGKFVAYVYEGKGNGGAYGSVTLLVGIHSDKTVKQIALRDNDFDPNDSHDSAELKKDEFVTAIFQGKSLADIESISGSLPGTTGVTNSSNGLKQAVVNCLKYVDVFAEGEVVL